MEVSYRLTSDMTSEEIIAQFFDKDALVESPEQIYRVDSKDYRYYVKFDKDQKPTFYVSVTTLIGMTTPTSKYLIKWIADMGYEESRKYMFERGDYGSFMHAEIAWLLINRSYNLDSLKGKLRAYIDENSLPFTFMEWEEDLKKDILAFAQFMIDCNVKPLAIEIALSHPDGYAGCLDLPCILDIKEKGFWGEVYKSGVNQGQQKETIKIRTVTAIIDFKSTRKGIYEDSEIQLFAYKKIWEYNFPSKPIEKLFNWSPKTWRKNPSYNLKDQTNSKNLAKFPHLVKLAMIEDSKRENEVTLTGGIIDFKKGLDQNINIMSLSEILNEKMKDEPEQTEQLHFDDSIESIEDQPTLL